MSKGKRLTWANNLLRQSRTALAPGRLHDAQWRAERDRLLQRMEEYFAEFKEPEGT